MKLTELKNAIEFAIENLREYDSPDDIQVIISLSEPSMGASAGTSIGFAGMGFDWERGQFRIEPSEKLVRKGKALYDVKSPRSEVFDGRTYFFCDNCGGGNRVAKDDKYCRCCGQRLR